MNESNDRDGLAAEYVLGTLDAGERAQALALLTADHAVAAKVRIWERRLSELHLMVEPIEPDGEIWDRIRHKIPHRSASVPVPAPVVDAEPVVAVAPAPEVVAEPAPAEAAIPAPNPTPEPVAFPPPPPLVFPPFAPAAIADQPAPKVARQTLESLEEAVLRAADALQQRAVAEPVVERAETPPASSEPAEADGKTAEVAGSAPEQAEEGPEKSPKTAETPAPSVTAEKAPSVTAEKEPTPSVSSEKREPKPPGPLSAFPAAFTAPTPPSPPVASPVLPPAPLVPSPPATVPVPPPVAVPSPTLAVRASERRRPPPAPVTRSHWLARTIAPLATLILLAAAVLVAAWRFAPERVPQPLRPIELLRAIGIATPTTVVGPPRRPAPPESQYDE